MTDKTQPTAHAEITAPISADLRRIDDAGAQPAPPKGCMIDLPRMREAALHAQVHGYVFKANGSEVRQVIDLLHEKTRELAALQASPPSPAAVAVPADQPTFEDWWRQEQLKTFPKEYDIAELPRWGLAFKQHALDAWNAHAALAAAPAQAADNLRCKSVQKRLAAMWGYVPAQEHATQLAGPVLHDIEAGVEVMAWLRENRAPHSIYSKMSACLFGDPDAPRAAPAQAQEDARDAARWRHFSARGVFPKNVWNNGNGHWQYGEIRALTAEGVADAAIAARAAQGGA